MNSQMIVRTCCKLPLNGCLQPDGFAVLNVVPVPVVSMVMTNVLMLSIAEKCFDIWGILKMASVKSVEPQNNFFSINHIIRCRSKFLPLGFSKFVLVLIL